MKLSRVLIIVFGILLVSTLISAKDQSFTVNYDYEILDNHNYNLTVDFSDVLMKVSTVSDSICKYDVVSGKSYGVMSEVFDETGGTLHKKSFVNLGDGNYRYYVKCKSSTFDGDPEEVEVLLRVNSLVTAQIELDKNDPLVAGRVQVKLVTSKIVSNTPSLSYSLDGVSYKPVTLVGAEKLWQGSIVLEEDLEEGVLSFKFSANDLEGRQGTEIVSGSYFDYDTSKPSLITDIKSESYEGEIKLIWYFDEDCKEFNIYRSELSNPDYTDFYKSTNKKYFTDTLVDTGETYYYRVSAVDAAGNEGDLSREVSGTSLIDEEDATTGLNPSLRGKVDSFIVEADTLKAEIENINSDISNMGDLEKEFFEKLGLNTEIEKALTEIGSLKSTAEKYKTQDLTEEELTSKLNSLGVKLGILNKNIPEDISILEKKNKVEDLSLDKAELVLFELNNLISEKDKEKSLKETEKIIKDNSLRVESNFYSFEIIYLDGSTKDFSAVKRNVLSPFEKMNDAYFVENIPSSVASDVDELTLINRNYNVVREDTILSFDTDTKEIFYYMPKVNNFNNLENIDFSFVKVVSDSVDGSTMTGFFVFNGGTEGYLGIFGIILLVLAGVYFFYSKYNNFSDDYFRIVNKINEGVENLESKDLEKAKGIYLSVKNKYSKLKLFERKRIYEKIELLYNDILIFEIKEGLFDLKKNKDKKLFSKLEVRFNSLSKENREKISDLFYKIKAEVENGN
ncbi:hypothetical protein GW932_02400 [archaeon]|nr:hypothetical protein [archaeon]